MSILEINNLSFGYNKEKLIYKDFNLVLDKGQIISIVGQSGSGKSTLFELITGNLKPLHGNINSKKIACIYQDPYSSFHPSFAIIEQIKDVITNLDEQEVQTLCEQIHLQKSLLYKKPHELIGGTL